jgi:hypothetical protein
LMFVRFAHDDILNEGKGVMLVHVRRVSEWVVLLEILDDVGMQCSVWNWPVGAE